MGASLDPGGPQWRYLAPAAHPQALEAGLRVGRLGRSSVRYGIGAFVQGNEEPCAYGHFVHVLVDRQSRKATSMPDRMRKSLERLSAEGSSPTGKRS
jgi:acyl-CoA thioester hydrolase